MKKTLLISALLAATSVDANVDISAVHSFPGVMNFMMPTQVEQGLYPFKPPVYLPAQNQLFGVVSAGGGALPIADPRMAPLALIPSAFYSITDLDSDSVTYDGNGNSLVPANAPPALIASFQTGVVTDSNGNVFGGSNSTLFKWNSTDGLVDILASIDVSTLGFSSFTLTGLLTVDDQDSVYFSIADVGGTNNSDDDEFALLKYSAEGTLSVVVNFAQDAYRQGSGTDAIYLKGHSPAAVIYSHEDNALYGLGHFDTTLAGAGNPENIEPGDKAAGTVFKINIADIKEDGTTAIDVLVTFSLDENGQIDNKSDNTHALAETADWLYGNSSKGVWRLNKTGSSELEMLHAFGAGQNGIAQVDDGYLPVGPVVIAADGNLYGTTKGRGSNDKAGVLYRINISADKASETDKHTDTFEIVNDFTAYSSVSPMGLSLGKTSADLQTVYGVTYGDNSGQTDTGSVFEFTVIPTSLTLAVDKTELQQGDTLEINWSSENLTACVASGDWDGEKVANSTGEALVVEKAGNSQFVLSCVNDAGKIYSQQVKVEVAAQPEPEPQPEPGPAESSNSSSSGGAFLWLSGLLGLIAYRRKNIANR